MYSKEFKLLWSWERSLLLPVDIIAELYNILLLILCKAWRRGRVSDLLRQGNTPGIFSSDSAKEFCLIEIRAAPHTIYCEGFTTDMTQPSSALKMQLLLFSEKH